VLLPALGWPYRAPAISDELDTTGFLAALERESLPTRRAAPVANPLLPFARPNNALGREGRPKDSVLVGERLFHMLGLVRGEELELATVVPDSAGNIAQAKRTFVVAGTFRTQDNETDGRRLYLDRRVMADFLNLRSPDTGRLLDYTEIVVRVRDYQVDASPLRLELAEDLYRQGLIEGDTTFGGPLDGQVRTWEDFRQSLLGAIKNERVLMAIMLSLILVVAGFTIFSILTMMVIEKRRDIGILSALGATRQGVLMTFLLIGFWNALLGTCLGALAGIQGALHIDAIERWLSSLVGYQIFDRSVYYFDEIPARIEPVAVLWIVCGAFACTLLFAAIPAWRAGRLDPLVALRYE
jgi:lipoprotein-releasing system permease protein